MLLHRLSKSQSFTHCVMYKTHLMIFYFQKGHECRYIIKILYWTTELNNLKNMGRTAKEEKHICQSFDLLLSWRCYLQLSIEPRHGSSPAMRLQTRAWSWNCTADAGVHVHHLHRLLDTHDQEQIRKPKGFWLKWQMSQHHSAWTCDFIFPFWTHFDERIGLGLSIYHRPCTWRNCYLGMRSHIFPIH